MNRLKPGDVVHRNCDDTQKCIVIETTKNVLVLLEDIETKKRTWCIQYEWRKEQ